MWKTVKLSIASLALALVIVMAGVVGHAIGDETTPTGNVSPVGAGDFQILDEIEQILEEDFVNPDALDHSQQRAGAIQGLIDSLGDPHTVYISPEDFATGIDIVSGAFEGIGAQVDQDPVTGEIVIVAPFRDSPAEKAGIVPGDVLVSVDGEPAAGWTVAEAVKRIRGRQGTKVMIGIRHSDGKEKEVLITRSTIVIPTVFAHEIEDSSGTPVENLAYIELQQFTDQTVDDLSKELKMVVDSGYEGIILDLRRNPGGGLDATVSVADMFLNQGIIITQVDRDGSETSFEARKGGEALDIPIVVLVGPGSASGSEVLAGALRDHDRATLIGEQTFGKGSVNHVRTLSDGGALYVTIARWKTPKGELIEGVGLAPDVKISATQEDTDAQRDVQLFAAIDFLQGDGTQTRQP